MGCSREERRESSMRDPLEPGTDPLTIIKFFSSSRIITTRFPSFFPATAHTLKYDRSEELGKNLALGVIYRFPKFLKIS